MRIIEHNDEMKITCKECGTILGIVVADVHDYPSKNNYFINCAACKEPNFFEIEELPKRWQSKLDPH